MPIYEIGDIVREEWMHVELTDPLIYNYLIIDKFSDVYYLAIILETGLTTKVIFSENSNKKVA